MDKCVNFRHPEADGKQVRVGDPLVGGRLSQDSANHPQGAASLSVMEEPTKFPRKGHSSIRWSKGHQLSREQPHCLRSPVGSGPVGGLCCWFQRHKVLCLPQWRALLAGLVHIPPHLWSHSWEVWPPRPWLLFSILFSPLLLPQAL